MFGISFDVSQLWIGFNVNKHADCIPFDFGIQIRTIVALWILGAPPVKTNFQFQILLTIFPSFFCTAWSECSWRWHWTFFRKVENREGSSCDFVLHWKHKFWGFERNWIGVLRLRIFNLRYKSRINVHAGIVGIKKEWEISNKTSC